MNIPLLAEITGLHGAPGYEDNVRVWLKEKLKSGYADQLKTDSIGNLIVHIPGNGPKVMVSAHMDEIGLIVTHIDSNGFVRFGTLGGFDWKTLINQQVCIHGKETVTGVIGSKAVHVMTDEEKKKNLSTEQLFIDTGMKADDLKKNVSVGDTITRHKPLTEIGDCVSSKALDNRASVYLLLELLLSDEFNPQCDFYGVFTVQEEVGLRGARIAADAIRPDIGINLDITIANDTPGSEEHKACTRLGDGAALKVMDSSVISTPALNRFIESIAEKEEIPLQKEILTAGGTDTSALQYLTGLGAQVTCISTPVRYVHSPVETASKNDIDAAFNLLSAAVNAIHTYDYTQTYQ
jgi:endoglucanase